MLRQRIRTTTSSLRFFGRALVVLFALGLIYLGVVAILLAVKVDPGTVNTITGYRSAFDFLADLRPDDATELTRAIAAGAGLLAFLVFGYLALKELPRPYLARHSTELERQERGRTTLEPGVIEELAEAAATSSADVVGARARFDDDEVLVDASTRRAGEIPQTLQTARDRVRAALEQHDLPAFPVTVRLAGYDRKTRRELN